MVTFDNPLYETLFNSTFTSDVEKELKIIKYEGGGCYTLPSMYTSEINQQYEDMVKKSIENMKKDLAKAELVMAFFTLMRQANVSYNPETEEE